MLVGNPINAVLGNKYEQVTDYHTSGQNTLEFTRYYTSIIPSATFSAALGSNWRSTYDRYLNIGSTSSVFVERANGQIFNFTLNGSTFTTDSDVDLTLTQSGSTWTLTDSADTVETYAAANGGGSSIFLVLNGVSNPVALLTSIRKRNGYTQTLRYDSANHLISVVDSYGRTLSFTSQNGLLQTVTTPDGLVLTYGYNSSGAMAGVLDRLASVSYSTLPATSQIYLYENSALSFALTGITDEDGNRYATWTYDSTGRALTSQHAGGADLTTVVYNDTDGSRTVTNALGQFEIYKFTTLQNVPKVTEIDRQATATTAAATRLFTYDGNGYLASKTDCNGNLTNYVNDVHGQPTSITEAAGTLAERVSAITYLSNFHLPSQIVTPGLTTNFTYDATGELLTRSAVDTTATTVPYATSGQTRTSTFTWSNFLLASAQGPRTDVTELTTFTYDAGGALTAVMNALGQATQITQHLPGGLPQTIVDANNVTTQLAYDARQRLLSSTVTTAAGRRTTSLAYDAAGNLTTITLPDGSALTETYDAAHRLVRVADLFDQRIDYTLDALGDRTLASVSNAGGATVTRKHSASFDALGRPLQDIGGVGQTTALAYDNVGNILTITDPLSRVTTRSFDALNRLAQLTDPASGVAAIAYDAHDRPTSVTDPNGNATTYVYDGFGDIIQTVSPDTGTATYHYDPAGNLVQRVDAAGVTTNYAYDALDRVISTTYPAEAAENITYKYDEAGGVFGIGRLTSVSDQVGTLKRVYDERGNIISETRSRDLAALLTSYTYDAASRVKTITYPSGWAVSYTRDRMGRITAIAATPRSSVSATSVVSSITYQPFGPVKSLTYGNGVVETRTFDLDYRQITLVAADPFSKVPKHPSGRPTVGDLQNLTYGYDTANNVLSIGDAVTSADSQTLGYDALDRLIQAAGSYGTFKYTYDPVGNRLTTGAQTYAYAAHSNRLASIANATGTLRSFLYTANGNIAEDRRQAETLDLTYNQANRLAQVTRGIHTLGEYTYDAFGQRLLKLTPQTTTDPTVFQYDLAGHLLEESVLSNGKTAKPVVDYIYLDGRPVGTISHGDKEVYFLHDDRLDTPQVVTDTHGGTDWIGTYQPFGRVSVLASVAQKLRFPGQFADAETGWYHNGFRDYAPALGRYLESDPIGLGGGLNTYAYVIGNPLRHVDPTGQIEVVDTNQDLTKVSNKYTLIQNSANAALTDDSNAMINNLNNGAGNAELILTRNAFMYGMHTAINHATSYCADRIFDAIDELGVTPEGTGVKLKSQNMNLAH